MVVIQIRIAQIDKEFNDILNTVTAENPESLLTDPRIEAQLLNFSILAIKGTSLVTAPYATKRFLLHSDTYVLSSLI